MTNQLQQQIPSVNFHLWEPCNMRCKFCYATFQDVRNTILPKGHLSKEQSIEVVRQLAKFGFEKITFAGGEPTLCPWLPDLIQTAKDFGMTTMVVTNGSRLTDLFLEANKTCLDWIALSIDSLNDETNLMTGRAIAGKRPLRIDYYKETVDKIKRDGYGLKINTVVNRNNHKEDMAEFISYAMPKRWKVLQVLPIGGQNDLEINDLVISEEEFQTFVSNHEHLKSITTIVAESNNQMKGSYVMVDPAGRFFDNSSGTHNYSRAILEVGVEDTLQQVNYDFSKFVSRGGIYNWTKPKTIPSKITISGEVASGKSTVGKLLAEKLSYSFVSIGNQTRAYAQERGKSIVEFQRDCLINSDLDKEIDARFSSDCNSKEKLVIDYRLGFKFIENAFHIYLNISEEVAQSRLSKALRVNETHLTLQERNTSFRNQFQNTYAIDYTNEKNYDLVIDAEQFKSADEIAEYIIKTFGQQ